MEKSLVEYKNDSASLVIVNPKVPVDSEDEESESDLPYEVHDVEIVSRSDQEESISDPAPVVAEVDVSGISSTLLCAVIVICCFVSILRD